MKKMSSALPLNQAVKRHVSRMTATMSQLDATCGIALPAPVTEARFIRVVCHGWCSYPTAAIQRVAQKSDCQQQPAPSPWRTASLPLLPPRLVLPVPLVHEHRVVPFLVLVCAVGGGETREFQLQAWRVQGEVRWQSTEKTETIRSFSPDRCRLREAAARTASGFFHSGFVRVSLCGL